MQKICAYIFIFINILIILFAGTYCAKAISYPKKYESIIEKVCSEFSIPQPTFYALVNTESSFNPNAKSSAGAIGLTQLLPKTAEYICVKNNLDYSNFNLYDPHDNLYIGAMYLRYLIDKFHTLYTALAAYNAGETVVRSWLANESYSYDQVSLYNIPYSETRNYIKKIKKAEQIYINFYKIKNN